jgi:NAD-dependent dihydropyrimidine dehydrogenase PreA subunit
MKYRYIKNVATLEYNIDSCVGCKRCSEVCPHGVFEIHDKKARITNKDLCMECGACALNCPTTSISVKAGVGCATAIIYSWFTGKEPTCGCSDDEQSCC